MVLNLLPIAMNATAILGCNKSFLYYEYLGNELKGGRDIPRFAEPIPMKGSVQAVSNKTYEQLGLDLNKNYKTVFSTALIASMAEEIQPDRIVYENRTYEVVENKNWYETNGYTKILVVELKEFRDNDTNKLQNQKPNI